MLVNARERGVCTPLAVLCAVWRAGVLRVGAAEEGSGSGSGAEGSSREPPLSPEAIANIVATAAALLVIGSAMCYLLMCFNRDERMQRVRMAQERNRQISKQIEAAKQKKRAQQHQQLAGSGQLETSREEERSAGNLLFSQAHQSHHLDDQEARTSRDKSNNPSQPLVSSTRTSNSKHTVT